MCSDILYEFENTTHLALQNILFSFWLWTSPFYMPKIRWIMFVSTLILHPGWTFISSWHRFTKFTIWRSHRWLVFMIVCFNCKYWDTCYSPLISINQKSMLLWKHSLITLFMSTSKFNGAEQDLVIVTYL